MSYVICFAIGVLVGIEWRLTHVNKYAQEIQKGIKEVIDRDVGAQFVDPVTFKDKYTNAEKIDDILE